MGSCLHPCVASVVWRLSSEVPSRGMVAESTASVCLLQRVLDSSTKGCNQQASRIALERHCPSGTRKKQACIHQPRSRSLYTFATLREFHSSSKCRWSRNSRVASASHRLQSKVNFQGKLFCRSSVMHSAGEKMRNHFKQVGGDCMGIFSFRWYF